MLCFNDAAGSVHHLGMHRKHGRKPVVLSRFGGKLDGKISFFIRLGGPFGDKLARGGQIKRPPPPERRAEIGAVYSVLDGGLLQRCTEIIFGAAGNGGFFAVLQFGRVGQGDFIFGAFVFVHAETGVPVYVAFIPFISGFHGVITQQAVFGQGDFVACRAVGVKR